MATPCRLAALRNGQRVFFGPRCTCHVSATVNAVGELAVEWKHLQWIASSLLSWVGLLFAFKAEYHVHNQMPRVERDDFFYYSKTNTLWCLTRQARGELETLKHLEASGVLAGSGPIPDDAESLPNGF